MTRVLAFVGKSFEFWLLLENGSSYGFGGSSVSFSHSDIIMFDEDIMKIIFYPH
jgi:hypothetical protein